MSVRFVGESNIGQKRQVNEDSLWPPTHQHPYRPDDPLGMLFIVADGMGGHGAGDIASSLAVSEISEKYYSAGDDYPDVGERLEFAIRSAHQLICERAPQSAETENMGTTVVAVVIKYNEASYRGEAWVAWVGDSRVYLLRGGRLRQVSRDHSRVWPLIEAGQITWDELRFHPDRSKVTNALTPRRPHAAPDIKRLELEPGDELLLCSDGLSGEVRPEEMEQIMAGSPPEQAASLLIDKANAAKEVFAHGQHLQVDGGNDNITAVIVQIPADQTQTQPLVVPAASTDTSPTFVAPPPVKKSSRLGLIIVGLLVVILLVAAGLIYLLSGSSYGGTTAGVAEVSLPSPTTAATTAPQSVIIAVGANDNQSPAPPTTEPTAINPAAAAASETRMPTVTRGPISSPTAPPTATFTPAPLPTATPTQLVTATTVLSLNVASLPAPTLLEPAADETGKLPFDTSRTVKFVWQWPAQLTDDLSFEIRVWLRDAEPTGAHDARFLKQDPSFRRLADNKYSVLLTLSGASGVTETSADYLWTVGVVRIEPNYEWLGVAAEPRPISLVVPSSPGGSSGSRPK